MIALDTNVVVRLLADDDPAQTRRARRLVDSQTVLLLPTVLLETEWVLRSAYGIRREIIAAAFRKLLGLPNVAVTNAEALVQALQWFENGLGFADALHIALAGDAEGLATLDGKLARRASAATGRRIFRI